MARKGRVGGRHIAMERGLKPGWCGWPFHSEQGNLGASEAAGGPTSQPGGRRRNTGRRGANGWPPLHGGGPFQEPSGEAATARDVQHVGL